MRIWTRRWLGYRFKTARRRGKNKSYSIYLAIALSILVFIYSFSVFEKRIRPTVTSIAEARASYIATRAVYEAVNEKLAEDNLKYEDLITFLQTSDGQITAIQANIVKMNQLKSALSMSVQQKIVHIDSTEISVPLGNMINSQILSGWGPRIPVRLIPVGTAEADFKSVFQTAGINQTKHQIFLEIHSTVSVLLPIATSTAEVVTTIPVAETIIVGTVPQHYINVEGVNATPDNILNIIGK